MDLYQAYKENILKKNKHKKNIQFLINFYKVIQNNEIKNVIIKNFLNQEELKIFWKQKKNIIILQKKRFNEFLESFRFFIFKSFLF